MPLHTWLAHKANCANGTLLVQSPTFTEFHLKNSVLYSTKQKENAYLVQLQVADQFL